MTERLISLLKDSSLVSVITVVELTKQMTITAVDVRSWGPAGASLRGAVLRDELPAGAPRPRGWRRAWARTKPRARCGRPRRERLRVEALRKAHGARQCCAASTPRLAERDHRAGRTIGRGKEHLPALPQRADVLRRGQRADRRRRIAAAHSAGRARASRAAGARRDGLQSLNLFPHLTAIENVSLAPVHVRKEAPDAARGRRRNCSRASASRTGPGPAGELSGGQQQRVASPAPCDGPEVLLLDEPTSALDPQMRGEVLAVLRDLARSGGMTMLVVTTRWPSPLAASRVWVFDDGRLVEDGPPRRCATARAASAPAPSSRTGDRRHR